jgi:HEAT repeat protein
MRWRRFAFLLTGCLVLGLCTLALAPDSNPGAEDEKILQAAGVATDGPSLLEFFRKRTLTREREEKIVALIRQLGDNAFRVREKASAELVALGVVAVPFLQQAINDPDIEVVRRAEECLRHIDDRDSRIGVPIAAARLVALRKPAGAAEVLLAFLPCVDNESAIEEVQTALAAVAVHEGKPEKVLVDALSDKSPTRRAAAAVALCRAGIPELKADLRKLFQDPDLTVRLRTAMALANAKEKDAIPILIDLLGELPPSRSWPAEDILLHLAEEQAPSPSSSGDAAARRQYRDAWAAWWRDHGARVDLAKLEGRKRLLGFTLIVQLEAGRALELDTEKKPRFQVEGLMLPLDAQMLPGERILVAEHDGNRVTERNNRGIVLWEKKIDRPLVAQRLTNGNTFIATQSELLEVDRGGKEVFRHTWLLNDTIMKAVKLPKGDMVCVTTAGRCVHLDATGKELRSFPASVKTYGGRLDVLPGGRVLIPEMNNNRVVEYDSEGKVLWQVTFFQPVAAVRLSNGNTLITSMRQNSAVEVDRTGREVWRYDSDTRVTRAFRR